ncbi:YeeE/YedE thiosulfate transporter family protein [Mesobacterium sp. TK19101]|uniref:YeeE/YedE thiosulfate transporter family protein n=1 Tax=Mesobacterium hydrothermale TaxID=3111907 RepID=A0ABU6HE47_9RHOB|nr:YeeE/YedE thiosulfate transporter family protein [Mesobacterium sp. TK19101]MEC3860382.1 YeeE/YedE thiosulfate transporter family protein [Mesobacterium sp. TK19101]
MQQDWIWGLIGGLLIGTGGAFYLLFNGRIMGASGIIGGLVDGSAGNTKWERVAFLIGVFLLPIILYPLYREVNPHITDNFAVLVAAGLLVGVGTRFANGCTSGHGVCGMSRLSVRGFVATCCYIFAGGVGVVIFRHILGVI